MSVSNSTSKEAPRRDVLVVGQGLAGSWLAYRLMELGLSVHVLDASHEGSSSLVAGGIINPITGKRIAKSWQLDKVHQVATEAYKALEQDLGQTFFHPCPLVRLYKDDEDKARVAKRFEDDDYKPWMHAIKPAEIPTIIGTRPGFAIDGAAWVDMPALLAAMGAFFEVHDALLIGNIDHSKIVLKSDHALYNNIRYRRVIFCEGHRATSNPFFQWLPFKPAKGEMLTLQTPSAAALGGTLVNAGSWCLPISDQSVKVGATYTWDPLDNEPTSAGKEALLKAFAELLPSADPGLITEHKAGVRPSTRDARPFIGIHPKHPALAMFNGFGSKGALLIPYYSTHFADVLMGKTTLDPDVDIMRHSDHHATH